MAGATMDKIVSLCKRRGFLFQGSELYGGLQGTWDYGPMGVELKNNVKRVWWSANVYERDDMEGLDSAILMNRNVLKYSGHEATFSDPMVDCRKCKKRFRADHVDAGEKCSSGGQTRPDRTPSVQPHVQDDGRASRERREYRVPETGNSPGHLRQLQERHRLHEPQAAVRYRADRQGVPQRDHTQELHLPRPGVRADGDRILRHAGHGRGMARTMDCRPRGLVSQVRHPTREPAEIRPGRG